MVSSDHALQNANDSYLLAGFLQLQSVDMVTQVQLFIKKKRDLSAGYLLERPSEEILLKNSRERVDIDTRALMGGEKKMEKVLLQDSPP
jgi:hypothetical protein